MHTYVFCVYVYQMGADREHIYHMTCGSPAWYCLDKQSSACVSFIWKLNLPIGYFLCTVIIQCNLETGRRYVKKKKKKVSHYILTVLYVYDTCIQPLFEKQILRWYFS